METAAPSSGPALSLPTPPETPHHISATVVLVPFPLEYALYRISVSPVNHSHPCNRESRVRGSFTVSTNLSGNGTREDARGGRRQQRALPQGSRVLGLASHGGGIRGFPSPSAAGRRCLQWTRRMGRDSSSTHSASFGEIRPARHGSGEIVDLHRHRLGGGVCRRRVDQHTGPLRRLAAKKTAHRSLGRPLPASRPPARSAYRRQTPCPPAPPAGSSHGIPHTRPCRSSPLMVFLRGRVRSPRVRGSVERGVLPILGRGPRRLGGRHVRSV